MDGQGGLFLTRLWLLLVGTYRPGPHYHGPNQQQEQWPPVDLAS